MASGHAKASRYPLARVWSEARTARRRMVNQLETEAVVMQSAIGSVISKKGHDAFKATLKRLREGGDGGA